MTSNGANVKPNKATDSISRDSLVVLKENLLERKFGKFIAECLLKMKGTDKEPLFQRLYDVIFKKNIM